MQSEDGFCPLCLSSGSKISLTKVCSPYGVISNICSSAGCTYPFCHYSALKHSDDANVKKFFDELFNNESTDIVSDRPHFNSSTTDMLSVHHSSTINTVSNSQESSENTVHQLPLDDVFPTNCMLPRYLADNMKRFVSEDNRNQRLRYSTTMNKDGLINRRLDRSCDSGISINSFSSLPSIPQSYTDYVSQRVVTSSSQTGSFFVHKTLPSSSKRIGHLDRMLKLHEQKMNLC